MSCKVSARAADLRSRKANVRCSELGGILTELGFTITPGRGNHKVVTHDGLEGFLSTSYDCGHGRDSQIKPQYIIKVAKVLSDYATELQGYLERNNG